MSDDQDQIERIRSNELVRDAFVECYTWQEIVTSERKNVVSAEDIAEWDRVESALIHAILGAAGQAHLTTEGK